ncbi:MULTISPECIES: FAD-dependent oxidoreductase [Streptomyces]|uniref:FAD-dependent oxidoreductase n=1 Tax=Streptomyces TaxID=1883 RepID=UPI0033D79840
MNAPTDITYDVVVAGGGSAGVAAAVSAAEEGARVLLVESSGSVGGTLSWQLLEHSAGFHDVHGEQVVAGFGQRLVDRLTAAGASPGHVRDDVGYTATRTPVDHAELALTQSVMLAEAGVDVWLQSVPVGLDRDGSRIAALHVHTSHGRRTVRAAAVVDATGDAAIAALAGAPFQNDTTAVQPVSLTFKLGGADIGALLAYLSENPDEIRPGSVLGSGMDDHANVWGLGALLSAGHASGALSLRRTEMHLALWPTRGEAVVNVTRATGAGGLGAAHAVLSRQVLEFVRWFRADVPGFGGCRLVAVADRVGVRESRRVRGVHTMTAAEVGDGTPFADAIGRGAFPIDIHAADGAGLSHTDAVGAGYAIPYRILLVPDPANLLVAGRCVSSTHEANGTLRITATCFVTGEAAGVAAAMAAHHGVVPAEVDTTRLQERLADRGVLLPTGAGRAAGCGARVGAG